MPLHPNTTIGDMDTLSKKQRAGAGASILLFCMVVLIPAIWINSAVTIKRFHDCDKSGFWYLICLVPYIGVFWQLVERGF